MNKKGFTLSELMISLAITVVIATFAGPTLTGLIPDKNKVQVLNCYKQAQDATAEILSTRGVYYKIDETEAVGLQLTAQPVVAPYNSDKFAGSNKYKNLLFDKLGIDENGLAVDGTVWTIVGDGKTPIEEYFITIDIDSKGKDCTFSDNCAHPDTFGFKVDKYGNILGNDPLSKAYLLNRNNFNDKKYDYNNAKKFISTSSSS